MNFGIGSQIPQSDLQVKGEGAIGVVKTEDYFKDSRVVMIAIPGAFTPTCSREHLPGFIEHYDEFRAMGVDKIACLSVNDAHVMKAWGEKMEFGEKIELLADPVGEFSEKLGLLRSHGSILGKRATRSAMVVDNGVVQQIFIEEKGKFEVSKAENVLDHI